MRAARQCRRLPATSERTGPRSSAAWTRALTWGRWRPWATCRGPGVGGVSGGHCARRTGLRREALNAPAAGALGERHVWRTFSLKPHLSEHIRAVDGPAVRRECARRGRLVPEPSGKGRGTLRRRQVAGPGAGPHPAPAAAETGTARALHARLPRHGTTSLFAAFDTATGKVIGRCYKQHQAVEFRKFLVVIDKALPPNVEVHLVPEN